MLDLEQVQAMLKDRRIDVVAQKTGLGYTTVWEIRAGVQTSPRYKTLKALSDYFEKLSEDC